MQSARNGADELHTAVLNQTSASGAAASISTATLLHDDIRGVTGLTSKQRAYLLKAGFTTSTEVLFTPIAALSERFKLSTSECQDIVDAVVRHRFAQSHDSQRTRCFHSQSVADQLGQLNLDEPESNRRLSTGDAGLDRVLEGGIVPGALTEFSGEAASGKTALCLQLAVQVQLPREEGGLAGSCAYLCSEGNFPSVRLYQIVESHLLKSSNRLDKSQLQNITDNVHLIHCSEVDTLQHAVQYALPALVERLEQSASINDGNGSVTKPVRLIIVDSIAAPFRGAEAAESEPKEKDGPGPPDSKDSRTSGQSTRYVFAERTRELTNIATGLLRLAQRYSIAVVIINQVSDVFVRHTYQYQQAQTGEAGETEHGSCPAEADRTGLPLEYRHYGYASRFFSGEAAGAHHRARAEARKMAVFGLSWTNCINARIMLSRTGRRKRRADGLELSEEQVLEQEQLEDQAAMYAVADDTSNGSRVTLVHSHTEEVRRADVVFCPFGELGRIDYVFRQSGVVSVGKYIQQPRLPKGIKLDRRKRKRAAEDENEASEGDDMLSQASNNSIADNQYDEGAHVGDARPQATGNASNGAILENEALPTSVADDNEASLWEDFASDEGLLDELQLRDEHGFTQVVPETQPG